MSLYHEAASIIETARRDGGGSLKSYVYSQKIWKSDPKTLFALTTETAKWSAVLSEIIEKSETLKIEKQLSPTLALVLTYDLLLSKRGIALPQQHGLNAAISRHKARLTSELTRARLKKGFATIQEFRAKIDADGEGGALNGNQNHIIGHPRWIRINTLRTTLQASLGSTFADYTPVYSLSRITKKDPSDNPKRVFVDEHIPNLIAVPSTVDVTSTSAYKGGELILQDKASCFPAYLLDPSVVEGNIIDACAAPGNKTTHLAAILFKTSKINHKILACEKDACRSETLAKMCKIAGGETIISIKAKQDFLQLDPQAAEFSNVSALLLDPSCSGSGIVGRDEGSFTVHLPRAPVHGQAPTKGKKRKRDEALPKPSSELEALPVEAASEEDPPVLDDDRDKLQIRLKNLSSFQLHLLEHAMAFPAACRITYSTCSIHVTENEHVVMRALLSHVAAERGWRIMKRGEQVDGLRKWHRRGDLSACRAVRIESGNAYSIDDAAVVADACIRCDKGIEDGTMGFFVAGFVRAGSSGSSEPAKGKLNDVENRMEERDPDTQSESEEEWTGFSDDER